MLEGPIPLGAVIVFSVSYDGCEGGVAACRAQVGRVSGIEPDEWIQFPFKRPLFGVSDQTVPNRIPLHILPFGILRISRPELCVPHLRLPDWMIGSAPPTARN
jgi:hypothetical protein